MGCMEETLELFKKCPKCGEPIPQINIYPFLTLEDWAGYFCSKCKTWVDAFITPEKPSEIFNTTGYEALPRILKRYERHVIKKQMPASKPERKPVIKCPCCGLYWWTIKPGEYGKANSENACNGVCINELPCPNCAPTPKLVPCPDCGTMVTIPVVNRRVQCKCGVWISWPGFTGPWVD